MHCPLLDLDQVAESQRGIQWRKAANSYFPGLSVRDLRGTPGAGSIEGGPFGLGSIWTVLSPPAAVDYRPQAGGSGEHHAIAVILQLEGSMAVEQGPRQCELEPGHMCLLDERSPFDLDARGGASRFTLMRMPRWMIVDRYPRIGQHTAVLIQDGDPGASLLRQMLRHVHELAPLLDDSQSGLALTSIVQLLGMPRTLGSHPDRGMGWRAQAALTFIDARLADSGLNASDVAAAQRIGRRHLDEILLRETGQATAAHIWRRRLETAAAELRNPRSAGRTVAEIALDTGFKDAAHFARAFKQRYRSTPRMWRSPVVTYSETAAGAAR